MKKFKPQPGFTVLAHKLALGPNAATNRHLYSHAGAARAAYNWAVAYITAVWWQRKAEQSYGIGEDQLTEWRSWSLPSLHKVTTRLASEYGTIVVEDLNVAGMGRNRRLSRRVADAASGEIRRQLTYKTRRRGTRLIVADRWYPSSKTCSRCGVVKAKPPLSMRVFECDNCGLVLDRDANAGHNPAALAARTTGTGVAGDLDLAKAKPKPRGADRTTRAIRPRRKAGTGRAGGAIPSPRAGKETGDRQQNTGAQLALR